MSEELLVDLVGEVANTISGNARYVFGKDFMISVPVVIEGAPSSIHLPKDLRSYVPQLEKLNLHLYAAGLRLTWDAILYIMGESEFPTNDDKFPRFKCVILHYRCWYCWA